MAYPRLTEDLDIIQKLDDEPNDVGGLSAAELKAKFDEGPNAIKDYINTVLLPAFEGTDGAGSTGIATIPGLTGAEDVQAALEALVVMIQEVTQGAVADGSITTVKLAELAVTTAKIAAAAVTEPKLASDSVTTPKVVDLAITAAKLAANAVETAKILDGAVTEPKIGAGAVTHAKLGAAAVGSTNIDSYAVTETKLANAAVTGTKIADSAVSRAKLADDALYSPVKLVPRNQTYALTVADIGKTFWEQWSSDASMNTVIWSLTAANSANMPVGAEIAFTYIYVANGYLSISGVRCVNVDLGVFVEKTTSATVKFEKRSMIALKKLEHSPANGDVWLLTGNVEVVT